LRGAVGTNIQTKRKKNIVLALLLHKKSWVASARPVDREMFKVRSWREKSRKREMGMGKNQKWTMHQ